MTHVWRGLGRRGKTNRLARPAGPQAAERRLAACTSAFMAEVPKAVVVSVQIKPDRIDDFLKVIEEDAIGSRERENGGCLRFDVLRDQSDPTKFIFYEVYKDDEAAARHRETPHFKLWTDFKASGGVVSQSAVKADAIFFGSRL